MRQLVPTRRGGLMLRRLMIVFVVAVGAAIFASSAAADRPTRIPFAGVTFSSVLTDVCPFPVTVDSTVSGTEIDFVAKGLNQQFVFRNPRMAAECGCGESFTTDEQAA